MTYGVFENRTITNTHKNRCKKMKESTFSLFAAQNTSNHPRKTFPIHIFIYFHFILFLIVFSKRQRLHSANIFVITSPLCEHTVIPFWLFSENPVNLNLFSFFISHSIGIEPFATFSSKISSRWDFRVAKITHRLKLKRIYEYLSRLTFLSAWWQ